MPIFSREELDAFDGLQADALRVLKEREKEYSVPDVPVEPIDEFAYVFRLPRQELKTEAGIVLATHSIYHDKDTNTTRGDEEPISLGILVAAGLGARDHLLSHGTFIGDIVKFTRYGGHEEESHRFMAKKGAVVTNVKQLLQIPAREIIGSLDLRERVWGEKPTLRIAYRANAEGEGIHVYVPVTKKGKK